MYPKIDLLVGLFIMVFSAVGQYMAGKLQTAPKGLGPGDYPMVILRVLFILGAIQTGYAFYTQKKKSGREGKKFEKGEFKQIFILFVCVALYIKLVAYFGFILLTPFFMFAMMYIFSLREWIRMAVISIVGTALIYIVFNNYLYVLLPRFNLF
jgi:hypothetical protein